MRTLMVPSAILVLATATPVYAADTCLARASDRWGVRDCLKDVVDGGEIVLADGVHVSDPLVITKNVTIRAQNAGKATLRNGRLLALNDETVFDLLRLNLPAEPLIYVEGVKLTLNDLKVEPPSVPVINPRVAAGRAIESKNAELILVNVEVSGHKAYVGSFDDEFPLGGLALIAWGGSVTIDGGNYSNLDGRSLVGGAIVLQGASLDLLGAPKLESNRALKGGAIAAYYDSPVTFHGTDALRATVRDNIAGFGGALYLYDADLHVKNADFSHNTSLHASGEGGHIYAYTNTVIIDGGRFAEGSAWHGGMLFARDSEVTIGAALIEGNTAAQGGGVYAFSMSGRLPLALQNTRMLKNVAVAGGGIYAYAMKVSLETATLTDNGALDPTVAAYGGALYCEVGSLEVQGGELRDNKAYDAGGALYAYQCPVSVSGGQWNSNAVSADESTGGAIAAFDGDVLFDAVEFDGNSATYGGALFASGNASLVIEGGSFRNNIASTGGGFFTFLDSVRLDSTSFVGNFASETAGAGAFVGGEANDGRSIDGDVYTTNIVVSDNEAPLAGGLRGNDVHAEHHRARFTNNVGTGTDNTDDEGSGGGYLQAFGSLVLDRGVFTGNTSSVGAAIATFDLDDARIHDSVFGNNDSERGAAVTMDGGATTFVARNVFCANSAEEGAADLLVMDLRDLHDQGGKTGVHNNLFDANGAESLGQLGLSRQGYEVRNNNFVHANQHSVSIAEGDGQLLRNMFAWNPGQPTVGFFDGTQPRPLVENAWYDPTRDDRVWVAANGVPVQLEAGHVGGDPMLRGAQQGVPLPIDDCTISNHYPMPWSPLLRGSTGLASRQEQIGMFGGPEASDEHWKDSDADGSPAIFDCDDDDAQIGECEGGAVREVVQWYGEGCSTTGSGTSWFALGFLPLLWVRRRKI